jgi:hypothetical protein
VPPLGDYRGAHARQTSPLLPQRARTRTPVSFSLQNGNFLGPREGTIIAFLDLGKWTP